MRKEFAQAVEKMAARDKKLIFITGDLGFMALEDNTILRYQQSQYYDYADPDQQTFKWDDPTFNIWWPIKQPILSRRDETGEYEFRVKR